MVAIVMQHALAPGLAVGTSVVIGNGARAQQSDHKRISVQSDAIVTRIENCVTGKCTSSSPPAGCFRRYVLQLGAALIGGSLAMPEARADDVAQEALDGKERSSANPQGELKQVERPDKVDTTITDRVFLDVSLCPNISRNNERTLGSTSQICNVGESEPLGRIVIGLFGKQVPETVRNFKAMCSGEAGTSYTSTIFHRVLPGQYIQAGRQGSRDKGEVSGLIKLERNQETLSPRSYKLNHWRPGTVSLCLAENDDEEDVKLDVDYRNVEFLITTGPGPAPQLDNGNIVFGTVLEGMDVVAAIAKVPTYKPNERIRQFNDFAEFLGDDRAANARNFWNRPLKTVVITKSGELPMGLPFFPPGLP